MKNNNLKSQLNAINCGDHRKSKPNSTTDSIADDSDVKDGLKLPTDFKMKKGLCCIIHDSSNMHFSGLQLNRHSSTSVVSPLGTSYNNSRKLASSLDTANSDACKLVSSLNTANSDACKLVSSLNTANSDACKLVSSLNTANSDACKLSSSLNTANNDSYRSCRLASPLDNSNNTYNNSEQYNYCNSDSNNKHFISSDNSGLNSSLGFSNTSKVLKPVEFEHDKRKNILRNQILELSSQYTAEDCIIIDVCDSDLDLDIDVNIKNSINSDINISLKPPGDISELTASGKVFLKEDHISQDWLSHYLNDKKYKKPSTELNLVGWQSSVSGSESLLEETDKEVEEDIIIISVLDEEKELLEHPLPYSEDTSFSHDTSKDSLERCPVLRGSASDMVSVLPAECPHSLLKARNAHKLVASEQVGIGNSVVTQTLVQTTSNVPYLNKPRTDNSLLVTNKPLNGDIDYESTVMPFKHKSSQENEDIENPEWDQIRQLKTDEQCYRIVRNLWKNTSVPNSNRNLTFHLFQKRRLQNKFKLARTVRSGKKRVCSNDIVFITPNKRLCTRNKSCTEIFDEKIQKYHEQLTEHQQKLQVVMKESQETLKTLFKLKHAEITYAHCFHMAKFRRYNPKKRTRLMQQSYWSMKKDLAELESWQDEQRNNLYYEHKKQIHTISTEFEKILKSLRQAKEEVLNFSKFYVGLGSEKDTTLLTGTQLLEVKETERMYKQYSLFYTHPTSI
ncbi:uncharacterized protein LOC111086389 [Limulus polyphemus]|uniref:Uncharacterized protein LOC111086389 n=1 Tax=Limulus polyphemus TaxID=6850 RepID=A0ABM1SM72_LIMPO|nr:uncharacterized protein LOC111086389 [Limulus polyphemus]